MVVDVQAFDDFEGLLVVLELDRVVTAVGIFKDLRELDCITALLIILLLLCLHFIALFC